MKKQIITKAKKADLTAIIIRARIEEFIKFGLMPGGGTSIGVVFSIN